MNIAFSKPGQLESKWAILFWYYLGKALKERPALSSNEIWGSNKCSVSRALKARSGFKIMHEMFKRLIVSNCLWIVPTALSKK